MAQLLLQQRRSAPAEIELRKAHAVLGLRLQLAGALGRRTKWQQHAVSQLVLKTEHGPTALPRPTDDGAAAAAPRALGPDDGPAAVAAAAAAAAAATAGVLPQSVAGDEPGGRRCKGIR